MVVDAPSGGDVCPLQNDHFGGLFYASIPDVGFNSISPWEAGSPAGALNYRARDISRCGCGDL